MSRPSTPHAYRRRLPVRRGFPGLLFATALLVAGCTPVGGPGTPPPPDETEPPRAQLESFEYGGTVSVQGSRLPVVLSMLVRGEDVQDVVLRIPEISMVARGDGSLRDGRLELDLDYGDDCAGEAHILGLVEQQGQVVHGTLAAEDCTGSEEGALDLRVR